MIQNCVRCGKEVASIRGRPLKYCDDCRKVVYAEQSHAGYLRWLAKHPKPACVRCGKPKKPHGTKYCVACSEWAEKESEKRAFARAVLRYQRLKVEERLFRFYWNNIPEKMRTQMCVRRSIELLKKTTEEKNMPISKEQFEKEGMGVMHKKNNITASVNDFMMRNAERAYTPYEVAQELKAKEHTIGIALRKLRMQNRVMRKRVGLEIYYAHQDSRFVVKEEKVPMKNDKCKRCGKGFHHPVSQRARKICDECKAGQ